MKFKQFIITDKVFLTEVLFFVNCKLEELGEKGKKWGLKKRDFKDFDKDVVGMAIEPKKRFFRIIWLRRFSGRVRDIGLLSHEIFHLVIDILENKEVGIKAIRKKGNQGDETGAYLMGFYLKEALKFL